MDQLIGKHWHHMPADEVLDILESDSEKGLDLFEVGERRARFGENVITTKKGRGPLLRFLLQFHQPLIYILLAAGIITAMLQEWVDAGVIFGVVLVNAVIGFVQEARAVKAMEALARTMVTEATVLRAGEKTRISSAEVVPGDIVLLQSGDKVPADLRLTTARDLQVDESALTGESVPARKAQEVLPHDTVLADRSNMAYGSTLVTFGQASGVVVAIGDHTEVGRISQLISETEELQTPLLRKIADFSRVLLYVILALAAVTFLVGVLRGQSAFDMFMAAVALAVGAIPEGLPAAMTITLAIGVARMARRRACLSGSVPGVVAGGVASVGLRLQLLAPHIGLSRSFSVILLPYSLSEPDDLTPPSMSRPFATLRTLSESKIVCCLLLVRAGRLDASFNVAEGHLVGCCHAVNEHSEAHHGSPGLVNAVAVIDLPKQRQTALQEHTALHQRALVNAETGNVVTEARLTTQVFDRLHIFEASPQPGSGPGPLAGSLIEPPDFALDINLTSSTVGQPIDVERSLERGQRLLGPAESHLATGGKAQQAGLGHRQAPLLGQCGPLFGQLQPPVVVSRGIVGLGYLLQDPHLKRSLCRRIGLESGQQQPDTGLLLSQADQQFSLGERCLITPAFVPGQVPFALAETIFSQSLIIALELAQHPAAAHAHFELQVGGIGLLLRHPDQEPVDEAQRLVFLVSKCQQLCLKELVRDLLREGLLLHPSTRVLLWSSRARRLAAPGGFSRT